MVTQNIKRNNQQSVEKNRNQRGMGDITFSESEHLFLLSWNTINFHLAWETNVGDVIEWHNPSNNADAGRGFKGFARHM